MISRIKQLLFFTTILLSLPHINCSVAPISGNGGSETINTYAVAERNGVIKKGASVRFVNPESWFQNIALNKPVVIDSTVSDSNGYFTIPDYIIRSYKKINLLIDCQNKGIFTTIELGKNFVLDTIYLEQHGTLSGTLTCKGDTPEYIALVGTDYITPFSPQTSQFSFTGIPPGEYTLIAVSINTTKNVSRLAEAGTQIITEAQEIESAFECDYTNLLIDNFDHEGYWSPLAKFQKKAYWYVVKSPHIPVTFPTTREIDTAYVNILDALVSSDGVFKGKSLHLEYLPVDNNITEFLIPGIRLGFNTVGFSNIDTISFMAKGNDQITVRLHGEEPWNMPQATYKVTLDSTWKLYKIATSDMLIKDTYHPSWQGVKSRLHWVTFPIELKGSSIWIDEVKFNNATINDLLFYKY